MTIAYVCGVLLVLMTVFVIGLLVGNAVAERHMIQEIGELWELSRKRDRELAEFMAGRDESRKQRTS